MYFSVGLNDVLIDLTFTWLHWLLQGFYAWTLISLARLYFCTLIAYCSKQKYIKFPSIIKVLACPNYLKHNLRF